jgi:flagellar biosynthesis/type III secretory pathway chaperone
VVTLVERHGPLRDQLVDLAWAEFERLSRRNQRAGGSLDDLITRLAKEKENLTRAIRIGGDLEALVSSLRAVEQELTAAIQERDQLRDETEVVGEFSSPADVAGRLDEVITRLSLTSPEFADVMRRLIPSFVIQPVQALDCPQIRPRAKLTLSLRAWGSDEEQDETIILDLFEPPLHVRHLNRVVAAKWDTPKASLRVLAVRLGLNYMTVKRALGYDRLMREAGLTAPYREVRDRPRRASRWARRQRQGSDPA